MIKTAQLEWSHGTPVSTEFSDVYFNKADGAAETRYVFIEGNQLESRWNKLDKDHFTIAETGFGTGLNFLCAWDLWLKNSKQEQHLHFLSVERFPLDKQSLKQALQVWPEFEYLINVLLEHYPPLVNGWHSLHLPNPQQTGGQVILHLFLGDIHDWLPQIDAKVDAWFLDGFAPSRNPDMWNENLFLQMARLTPFSGTVATFTAASKIQRLLKASGFQVSKRKGYGHKREMVMASQQFTNGPQPQPWLSQKPWLITRHNQPFQEKTAIVIGAGIAGCSSAYSLAKRGWKVTVLEQDTIANGASGNSQGVLYAKLAAEMNVHSQFYLSGYLFSLQNLKLELADKTNWDNCGVLQLATNEKEVKRQDNFCKKYQLDDVVVPVTSEQASSIANIHIAYPGLFFKDGAWVYPKAWCEKMLQHKNIQVIENTLATGISQVKDSDGNAYWQVDLKTQLPLNSDVVIICNANQAKQFTGLDFIPSKPISGQVTKLASQEITLNTVLCGDHYVTPTHNGDLNFGASYRIKSDSTDVLDEDNTDNINNLIKTFAEIKPQLDLSQAVSGRASVRCTSPDYTPMAGPICNQDRFMEDFLALKKNRKWRFQQSAQFLTGLYINIAHGSRGLSSAPLCSELIASQITGEPLPLPKEQADLLNPNRFLVAKVIKG